MHQIFLNLIKLNLYCIKNFHKQTGISRSFIRKVKNGYIPSHTHHLELCSNEIKKIIDIPNYDGWFFDLETDSGTFHAGIGQAVIHNSPRRGENFVTRKITKYIGQIATNNLHNKKLHLGNLEAKRDWGHAKDYIVAMYLMLQTSSPDDYVISTGQTYTVRNFLETAFSLVNLDYNDYIYIDPEFYRPCEVNYLKGDSSKAKKQLNWEPCVSFNSLVKEMVYFDIENSKNEKKL
jgi:GDPmannose 4,6-dehydratase